MGRLFKWWVAMAPYLYIRAGSSIVSIDTRIRRIYPHRKDDGRGVSITFDLDVSWRIFSWWILFRPIQASTFLLAGLFCPISVGHFFTYLFWMGFCSPKFHKNTTWCLLYFVSRGFQKFMSVCHTLILLARPSISIEIRSIQCRTAAEKIHFVQPQSI